MTKNLHPGTNDDFLTDGSAATEDSEDMPHKQQFNTKKRSPSNSRSEQHQHNHKSRKATKEDSPQSSTATESTTAIFLVKNGTISSKKATPTVHKADADNFLDGMPNHNQQSGPKRRNSYDSYEDPKPKKTQGSWHAFFLLPYCSLLLFLLLFY